MLFSAEKLSFVPSEVWRAMLSKRKDKIEVHTRDKFVMSNPLFFLSQIYPVDNG